ncbi:MAG: alpha/beta hydrolase domain-containing protein [Acidobacteria bacterium]|nr:alpha/beta hydrolase domain-containing protein [Acidobacteriota bacterium]
MMRPPRSPRAVLYAVAIAFVALLPAGSAQAQITDFALEVVESPALGGRHFGAAGQYEWLRGVVEGAIDPADPRHRHIVNLDRAPRNDAGRVEYRATVEVYRPLDMSRWNRAIFHTVANRGRGGAAETALLERGFAFVRVGWQGDLTPTASNIVAYLPVATNDDRSPIVGPALEEFIFNDGERRSRARLTYPAASLEARGGMLSVRATQDARRERPDGLRWRYAGEREIEIDRPAGFDGGAIYEFIYQARDPIVLGIGFAAMRDAISFLRYETADAAGNANPLATGDGLARTAMSLGISQSGRMLRDFLYQGFNEDTAGRIVFDGMHPNIAGSRKTFTNYQFGQPGRWQKQHEDHVYPGDQFPFTYATLTDPLTGRTDGLLERCRASGTCPKIVHSDGEAELWQARASLVVTDPAGEHVELPDNVRVYLLAGTQHGGGPGVHTQPPGRGMCQNLTNPLALADTRTALSVALHEWVAKGVEPPASRFPTVAGGGLVASHAVAFPDIPGVTYSGSYNPLHVADHRSLPPMQGDAYTVLVGRVDADGNMVDGVRHPNLAAPIGTHTGWNLRRAGFAEGAQCAGAGSFIPFAPTEAARRASGDPRPSFEARYADHAAYVEAISEAADALVRERLLLPADAERIVGLARRSGATTQQ